MNIIILCGNASDNATPYDSVPMSRRPTHSEWACLCSTISVEKFNRFSTHFPKSVISYLVNEIFILVSR